MVGTNVSDMDVHTWVSEIYIYLTVEETNEFTLFEIPPRLRPAPVQQAMEQGLLKKVRQDKIYDDRWVWTLTEKGKRIGRGNFF